MKLCIAQTRSFKGDIERNIGTHKRMIELALEKGIDLIIFPELSLSGYEPTLAEELATIQEDSRLDIFQHISDKELVVICIGLPTRSEAGVHISLVIFQPDTPRSTYSKQYLHKDELPYFLPGDQPMILSLGDKKIALAICYESLLPEHAEDAAQQGAAIYLASVAKAAKGVEKAFKHYPEIAKKHGMLVMMANSVGPNDDFESAGQSAVWNASGTLVHQLDDHNEGFLIYNTETEAVTTWTAEGHRAEGNF
ncbi:MAG: carbon-nitrogen hydrolase family protein [Bacteroidia bacterium]